MWTTPIKQDLKRLTKPALKRKMRAHQKTIKQLKKEFLSNEVNDLQTLEIWLEKAYYDIRPVYKEIMNRYSSLEVKTTLSKINFEIISSKMHTSQWEL